MHRKLRFGTQALCGESKGFANRFLSHDRKFLFSRIYEHIAVKFSLGVRIAFSHAFALNLDLSFRRKRILHFLRSKEKDCACLFATKNALATSGLPPTKPNNELPNKKQRHRFGNLLALRGRRESPTRATFEHTRSVQDSSTRLTGSTSSQLRRTTLGQNCVVGTFIG